MAEVEYLWLKDIEIDIGEHFPYLTINLEIESIWEVEVPFYTFMITDLHIAGVNLGHYLYIGEYINTSIKPKETLKISANLKIIDAHAETIKNNIIELIKEKRNTTISSNCDIFLINYHYNYNIPQKDIPSSLLNKWLTTRDSEIKSDFIPVPHPIVLGVNVLKNIEKKLKPLLIILESGIDALYDHIEKDIKRKYEDLEPISMLINKAMEISNGNLDYNWALSTLSLSLMENIVNIKLKEFNIETSGEFSRRVEKLKRNLIEKERWDKREASDLARKLSEKYRGRSIIIHGGFENPINDATASEDFIFVIDLIRKLFRT